MPSIPRETCYLGGCYHLQGDGVAVPYQWVWVPAPPPPRVPGVIRYPAGPMPSQSGPLYRWIDEQGTVHWTQGLDAVPERYRARLKPGPSG